MNSLVILIITTIISVLLGYLVNQLPPIQNFPGKNVRLFRLLAWMVALGVIVGALANEQLAALHPWLKTGTYIVGTLLLFDIGQFGWAAWKHQRSSSEMAGVDAET